jgi:hypothetical protein
MNNSKNINGANDVELTDEDIKINKYPLEVLIKNVLNLSIKVLVSNQYLDADFCNKYVLNEEYQTVDESYLIDIDWVLKRQPHLKRKDLHETFTQ